MKDRLAADFSEIQSGGLRSRGRYGNTVSNFDSSPTLKFRWNFWRKKLQRRIFRAGAKIKNQN